MNLYDNVAFVLREYPKVESQVRDIVKEKMDLVGLLGAEDKLPGEISGGMRKRFLNQLIIDLNAQIDATFLIVTHHINTARTVPDNIGLLYHKHLVMFGPREMLRSSEEPVARQFLNAQRIPPDRDVGGAGRRRARGRVRPGVAAAAADPVAAGAVQRHLAPLPSRAGVPGVTSTGSPRLCTPSPATSQLFLYRALRCTPTAAVV